MRLTKLLSILLLLFTITMLPVSCSKENDDFDDLDNVEQGNGNSSNPMVGKTIRYKDNQESSLMRIKIDDYYQFTSSDRYKMQITEKVEEYDLAKKQWEVSSSVNKSEMGKYEYSDSQIKIMPDGGGSYSLKKTAEGWSEGGSRLFK